jgi:hypothetical protein
MDSVYILLCTIKLYSTKSGPDIYDGHLLLSISIHQLQQMYHTQQDANNRRKRTGMQVNGLYGNSVLSAQLVYKLWLFEK